MISTSIGGTAHFAIKVQNTGGYADQFSIGVSGLDTCWLDLSRTLVYLLTGEIDQVDLTVSVPENPSAVGTYLFNVSVHSSSLMERKRLHS
jgi:uncharacterized membrane protein